MEPTPEPGSRPTPPIPQLLNELRELIVGYLKQETVVPLKALRRYVLFGVAGSLLVGLGVLFLALAGLRALQSETDGTFDGNWSWAPYAIVVAALLVGGVIAARFARSRGSTRGTKE